MRIYGLTSPFKSQGWLLSVIYLGLAILYLPIPGLPQPIPYFAMAINGPLAGMWYGWHENFSYVLSTGGVVWQVLAYLRERNTLNLVWSGRALFVQFAPVCFVPVTLAVSAFFLWRRGVDYAPRPTVTRGVLAASLSLLVSLALIFLLDLIGGRVFLYIIQVSITTNIEIRSLISIIWVISLIQSIILALPCLAAGGLLAWRQRHLEARLTALRRNSLTARQELNE